ncbi:MAG: hypothetical protein N2A42_01175, partial [Luteolibacter sp.]
MIQNFVSRPRFTASAIVTATLLVAPQLFAQGTAPVEQDTLLDRWIFDGGYTMILIGVAVMGFVALAVYTFMSLTISKFCPYVLQT